MKMEETNNRKKGGTTSEHNINTGKTFNPNNRNKKKEKNVTVVELLFENATTFTSRHKCHCLLDLVQTLR